VKVADKALLSNKNRIVRVQANAAGVEYKRTRNGRLFLGLALRRAATAYTPPYESKDW
jgi:hypothetical protein